MLDTPGTRRHQILPASPVAPGCVAGGVLWLGNQWASGLKESPPGPRNHDLLYWASFDFDAAGMIRQLTWQPRVTVHVPG